jgi:hypothetical protein
MSDNLMIAVFMGGWNKDMHTRNIGINIPHMQNEWYDIDHLGYHESWDWLMPVVEKIEGMTNVSVIIKKSRCRILVGKKVFSCHTIVKLNSMYRVIVEFIRWHNSIPKETKTL